jgi:hypothetical protein
MILLTTRPAWSADQIPCWKAKAFITYAGSVSEAEKLAEKHGYTRTQIAEVRRRCGL